MQRLAWQRGAWASRPVDVGGAPTEGKINGLQLQTSLLVRADAKGFSGALKNRPREVKQLIDPSNNSPPLGCWRMPQRSHC